jgi:hypothetical protein
MHVNDNVQHHLPHIHAYYQGESAVFSILDGTLLAGKLPRRQRRLVQAWIEIRIEELATNWELAVQGTAPSAIEPLS